MSDQSPTPPPSYGTPPPPPVPPGYGQVPPYAPSAYGQTPPAAVPPAEQQHEYPQYGGFAAPSVAPYAPGYAHVVAPQRPAERSTLGLVALLLATVALIVPAVLAAVAGWNVGTRATEELILRRSPGAWDLSILTPVRDWVLLGEVAFYAGTALGIWAIVQGIIAIVRRAGRGQGIGALVIAVIAPLVFGTVVYAVVVAGIATGATSFT